MKAKIIDGSYGEGGGQILRYAALYSVLTGFDVHVVRIRANRPNPGLRPQHYTLLRIMKDMFGGRIYGLEVGSREVRMSFKGVRPVNGMYNIGTAGSISLIIQAITPLLLTADSTSELTIVGGTDVRWSPPIDYMAYAYSSLIRYIGGYMEVKVDRRGFYPKGGGRVRILIEPGKIKSINKVIRGDLERVIVSNVVCGLPRHVLDRQGETIEKLIRRSVDIEDVERKNTYCNDSLDPGTSIVVLGCDGELCCGGDSLGERGKRAETVAEEAFSKFMRWYSTGAAFDKHLGDMVIPLSMLSNEKSIFTVEEFTKHMESALYVAKVFYDNLKYEVKRVGQTYLLELSR